MAQADTNTNGAQQQADAFVRMWADFASRMAAAGMSYQPDSTPPQMTREMRDAMLNAMGEQCNQFMRSPQFLEMIKQSMRASIDMRKQMNDFLGRMHHDMQGASRQDVDQIMLSLRHLEHRIVDTVDRVDERLDAITQRLDALEAKMANGSASKPRRTTTAKASGTASKTSAGKKAPRKAKPKKK